MVRSCRSLSFSSSTEGRLAPLLLHLPLPSSLWHPPTAQTRSRGYSQRVVAAASLGCWYRECRISRSAASERIALSLEDTPFVSQQSSFLVTNVMRFDLRSFLQLHQFDVLKESMLVSHAQLRFQLCVCIFFTLTGRASTIPKQSVANPVRGHKEIRRRSTGHIMVRTRYSNQQSYKSLHNPCQVQTPENIGNLFASR